jgi:hypothetical protein
LARAAAPRPEVPCDLGIVTGTSSLKRSASPRRRNVSMASQSALVSGSECYYVQVFRASRIPTIWLGARWLPILKAPLRCTRLVPASVVCFCRRERRSAASSAVCTIAPRARSARRACCRRPGLRGVDDGLDQAFTSAATSIRWPSKPTRSRRERRGGRWRIRSRTRLAKGSRPPILFLNYGTAISPCSLLVELGLD